MMNRPLLILLIQLIPFLSLCAIIAVPLKAIAEQAQIPYFRKLSPQNHDRQPSHHYEKAYLRCAVKDYICDDAPKEDERIHYCHYSGKEFLTVCVPSRSSLVQHWHPLDYCGPCVENGNRTATQKFTSTQELRTAVHRYYTTASSSSSSSKSDYPELAATYGWPIGNWDVSDIQDFSDLFAKKTTFDEDLSGWNMSLATNLDRMFWFCQDFQGTGLDQWDVSQVTSMDRTFYAAERFAADISTWNTSRVQTMEGLFWKAASFNAPIMNWDVSQVQIMSHVFHDASSFDQDVSQWNTSSVVDLSYAFMGACSFQQVLAQWNISRVVNLDQCFANAPYFESTIVQHTLLQSWRKMVFPDEALLSHMFTIPLYTTSTTGTTAAADSEAGDDESSIDDTRSNIPSFLKSAILQHQQGTNDTQQQVVVDLEVDLSPSASPAAPRLNNDSERNDGNDEDTIISREIFCPGGVCM